MPTPVGLRGIHAADVDAQFSDGVGIRKLGASKALLFAKAGAMGVKAQTISMGGAALTLIASGTPTAGQALLDGIVLLVDPGGSSRALTLPSAGNIGGTVLLVVNTADAAEQVQVTDPDGTMSTINVEQNGMGIFVSNGTRFYGAEFV